MDDLHHEFHLSTLKAGASHMKALHGMGVPVQALASVDPPLWGAVPVVTDDGGAFQFAPAGRAAVILPAGYASPAGRWEELDDLVCFYPARPWEWWRRRLDATHLGLDYLADCEFTDTPARLVATPLDWLRCAGQAVCLLDWSCDPRFILSGVRAVACDSRELAEHLDARVRAVSAWPVEIMTPKARGLKAA